MLSDKASHFIVSYEDPLYRVQGRLASLAAEPLRAAAGGPASRLDLASLSVRVAPERNLHEKPQPDFARTVSPACCVRERTSSWGAIPHAVPMSPRRAHWHSSPEVM